MQMFHVYWFSKVSTFQSQESLIYVLFCAYIKLDNLFCSGSQLVTMEQGRREQFAQSHIWQSGWAELDVERSHGRVW